MPGLINTHSHIPMSIFRETLDGYNLQDWLTKKIWPMEDKLTEEDIYYASYLSFIEMIKTGTTTVNDMYSMAESIIKAMQETGVRLQTTRTLMDIAGEADGEKRLIELEDLIKNYNNIDKKLTLNVGIHGLYTNTTSYVEKSIKVAEKYNLPIHIHFCENAGELEDIKKIHNKSAVELLKEKFKNNKLILAHCVKLTKNDIKEMKNMHISVSHCPVSNLKLGCGIADIDEMLKNNINVTLGTDGQGSGSSLDMFETMKFTALLQKGINENPALLPAYEVLKMATINGAIALGLEKEIGTIEEGKSADVIILNINEPTIKPVNNLLSEIVYNVKGNNVETTIIDGKVLMKDRKLAGINEEKIYKMCEKIIKRIET